jgi:hypothetical protein
MEKNHENNKFTFVKNGPRSAFVKKVNPGSHLLSADQELFFYRSEFKSLTWIWIWI